MFPEIQKEAGRAAMSERFLGFISLVPLSFRYHHHFHLARMTCSSVDHGGDSGVMTRLLRFPGLQESERYQKDDGRAKYSVSKLVAPLEIPPFTPRLAWDWRRVRCRSKWRLPLD